MEPEEFQTFLAQQEHDGKRIANLLNEYFDCFLLFGFSPKGPGREGQEVRLRGYGNNLSARAIRDAMMDELERVDMLLESRQHDM